jgi:hypothetical protein
MEDDREPYQIIEDLTSAYEDCTDDEVLESLRALPALADESDPVWENDEYWGETAYRFVALADVAAQRRLRPAIRLLLDRACYGDPGEIMRGLRHSLEAIVDPDWTTLADVCLQAARSPRLGTKLWAIDQLAVLDDPRARPLFEDAVRHGPEDIKSVAQIGLDRLGKTD